MIRLILFLVLFCSIVQADTGALYIKLSGGFFAGTEYKAFNDTTYIKSNIETKIKDFALGSFGFVPEKVIYSIEFGHKITPEFEVIYKHECPHTIDGFKDYDYINYNQMTFRRYTK